MVAFATFASRLDVPLWGKAAVEAMRSKSRPRGDIPDNRQDTERWLDYKPGQSGNPVGRTKVLAEVQELV
jgi:hypothetical protein